jgi:phosphatidylethanolamine/phosphatidyl-N-methylethanolamine N-methyltransferase
MNAKGGFLHERRVMWQAFRKDFFHTGSLVPSSHYLGRELAANLRGDRPPARILEIGGGTGPVTAQILPLLRDDDQFDVVEINGDFVKHLCERFQVNEPSPLDSTPAHFRILHAPVQDVPGQGVYQHLISGLPFNNFPIKLVREIWKNIHRLAAPNATFAFFEYVAIREMKMPFVARDEKKRLQLVGRHLEREMKLHQIHARKVFLNVPPAVVHHLRFG